MVSFQRLWENIETAKKEGSPKDDRAMSAIRTGIGIRDEFWDDFLSVINNSEGLAALLDVPPLKIGTWHQRVKENLDKVRQADASPDVKDSGKMLKTGTGDDATDPHTIIMNPVG